MTVQQQLSDLVCTLCSQVRAMPCCRPGTSRNRSWNPTGGAGHIPAASGCDVGHVSPVSRSEVNVRPSPPGDVS